MLKTAYEVRISDWSSDVCSSNLENQDHQVYMDEINRLKEGIAKRDVYISNIEELNSILTIVTNNAYDYDSDRDLALRHEQLLRDLNARIDRKSTRLNSSH